LFVGSFGEPFCAARDNHVPGEEVAITGAGFGAGTTVTLTLASGAYTSTFATATATGTGRLDTVAVIPANAPMNAEPCSRRAAPARRASRACSWRACT
jgi:hypothetical protein